MTANTKPTSSVDDWLGFLFNLFQFTIFPLWTTNEETLGISGISSDILLSLRSRAMSFRRLFSCVHIPVLDKRTGDFAHLSDFYSTTQKYARQDIERENAASLWHKLNRLCATKYIEEYMFGFFVWLQRKKNARHRTDFKSYGRASHCVWEAVLI